ncbi:efflux RND transporter periplasmic adaptor subunit [Helicobacter mustelae]|uniref:Putative membrane fusion component of efflux system n=1 Tax=Helicobacter mustelae (strain ATCC 43772 / CCUG 25715 / CIP 103759 / LMG 18044 / NCTC 12198 / R85-136P) TaxID=679897 RepID=D3UGQ4_HELM1|nr:HlyD family efflux transporter periplasmic adaptor subunit [Helicobacter mustelae]CBG39675.1 putative membrane fusion component of efflux system [Helicobacter mustelae 12198]SQH71181.1 membrane fusion component of efflux system [Helicobacter mustelae]STP12308.1 membrane fusion component of efflux system [Helicobacter mustelae]
MKKILIHLFCGLGLSFGVDVYAIFNIQAVQDSDLALDSSGIVGSLYVDVGSVVKKGDVLLKLVNDDKVAQASSTKQQYIFAKNQYLRYQKTGGAVDKNSMEQYYSNYKKLEADYNYSQTLIEKTILRASFDGVIAARYIQLGDGVGSTATKLFRLVSHDKKFVIEFDSKYIHQVKVGDVFYYSVDGSSDKKQVVITKIYPTIDINTRKVSAEAKADQKMIPGIFGDGFIRTK